MFVCKRTNVWVYVLQKGLREERGLTNDVYIKCVSLHGIALYNDQGE